MNTPQRLSTGMSALRRQCFQTTVVSLTPLIRASLTNSLSSVSSMLERISRMKPATRNVPSVIVGMM